MGCRKISCIRSKSKKKKKKSLVKGLEKYIKKKKTHKEGNEAWNML